MSDNLKNLAAAGTSPWLDNIRRGWLSRASFERWSTTASLG